MSHDYSVKTQIFSLIGRPIVLNEVHFINNGPAKQKLLYGTIVAKTPYKMRFGIKFSDVGGVFWFDRADFRLPPLPRSKRPVEWMHDDFDGFVYADVEGF